MSGIKNIYTCKKIIFRMGIIELKYSDKSITTKSEILKKLKELGFNWLIDSEVENAIIEIKKETLIWHEGIFK